MHVKRQQYSTAQETGGRGPGSAAGGIIRLRDEVHEIEVAVMPSFGNAAVEMKVHGKNIFYFPASDSAGVRKMGGIPILAPWANRLGGPELRVNGRTYPLRTNLGNI